MHVWVNEHDLESGIEIFTIVLFGKETKIKSHE
jgi:hypothetical protein